MKRRHFVAAAVMAGAVKVSVTSPLNRMLSEEEAVREGKSIHESILTLDTHVDLEIDPGKDVLDLGRRLENRKVDLVRMREGGLDAVFLAVWVGQKELTETEYAEAYKKAVLLFGAIHRMCEELNSDLIELALTPDDVVGINKKGRLVAAIGVENGFPLGMDIARVREFYDLGARYITLTHMGYNQLGDSSNKTKEIPAEKYGGLTDFGKQVVHEMNRLGMMVDVSHVSINSFYDALSVSKAPVIASHSGCRAVCDVERNLDDDQLRALRENGGVIQVVAYGGYVKKPAEEANLACFVDHIDHAVNLMGIDHVGIGADFDGGGGIPGYNDASECMNVTVELVRRGYSRDDIEKIWGGNLLRVWREVEKTAADMRDESKYPDLFIKIHRTRICADRTDLR